MFRRIMVAVDPTHAEEGGRALSTALAQLAGDGEIRLLTVISADGTAFFPYVPDQPVEETENQAHKHLEALAGEYIPEGVDYRTDVIHGVTNHALADEAGAWKADLLVLTSHGSGRTLRRDTVQKLCDAAPCAVLVLPAPRA